MKFAAFVCFGGACDWEGGESLCEDEEPPDHACRKGDGTTGTVGFAESWGGRRREDDDAPLTLAGVPFKVWVGVGGPLETGKGSACEVLVGDGSGADDRYDGFGESPWVPLVVGPLGEAED